LALQSVLALLFEDLGVSDTDVGNVGFSGLIAQMVGLFVVAMVMDRFRAKIKAVMVVLMIISAVAFAWLTVLCYEFIPYKCAQLVLIKSNSVCPLQAWLSFTLAPFFLLQLFTHALHSSSKWHS